MEEQILKRPSENIFRRPDIGFDAKVIHRIHSDSSFAIAKYLASFVLDSE